MPFWYLLPTTTDSNNCNFKTSTFSCALSEQREMDLALASIYQINKKNVSSQGMFDISYQRG